MFYFLIQLSFYVNTNWHFGLHFLLLFIFKKLNHNTMFFLSCTSSNEWKCFWHKTFVCNNVCNSNVGRHRNITIFVAMEHNLSREQWSKIDLIYFTPVLQGHFICSTQQFSFNLKKKKWLWGTKILWDAHAMEQCYIACAQNKALITP